MLDVKMTDQLAEHEIAGHEIAGHENAGMKQQDTKEHTSGECLRQNKLSIDLAFLLGGLCFMFHNDVQYRERKHIFYSIVFDVFQK